MRAMGTNHGARWHGVFTDRVRRTDAGTSSVTLTICVFLAKSGRRRKVEIRDGVQAGEWTATPPRFWCSGSNSILRSYAEVYAQDDNTEKFLKDFVAACGQSHEC